MSRTRSLTLAALALTPLVGRVDAATIDDTISELRESLTYGKPSLFLRYRYEHVDQETLATTRHDGYAATSRVAIGYETKPFHGVSVFGQFEGVFANAKSHHGGTPASTAANGRAFHSAILDPEGSELNQAWVKYAPGYAPRTAVKAGRQEISLDNQRFVGPVGWRQNWQSFDAVSLTTSYLENTTFFYAWLDHVHRILGDDSPVGDIDFDASHLVNLAYKVPDIGTLTGYAYLVDMDPQPPNVAAQTGFGNQSTQTFGLRFNGTYKFDADWSAVYLAEGAKQQDYGDNSLVELDAHYLAGELGGGWRGLVLKLGYELLSGEDGTATDEMNTFTTPLATLHAFNGWADMFLNTPRTGLQDAYISLGGPIPITVPWFDSFRFAVVYHQYASDADSIHYGDEMNYLLEYQVKKLDPNWILGVKYADYTADDGEDAAFPGTTPGAAQPQNVDTRKLWLYTQYSF
ncbi:MAG: alginate export family protein [Planctomycetes bacterium]|nr:alginate export family protein [Planctomycetota bacterium]